MPTPVHMARAKAESERLPLTFHQAASDRDALPEWVDDLSAAALAAAPRSSGAAASLVQRLSGELEKHDVVALELERRTAMHSPQLAKLWAQLRAAASGVRTAVVRECEHFDAASSTFAEEQRAAGEAALLEKKKLQRMVTECEMDLAVARAAVRDREASELQLRSSNAQLHAEVASLRLMIGRYIEGHSDGVEEDQLTDEIAMETRRLEIEVNSDGDPYSAAAIQKLAHARVQSVFEINDEIDALFASVEQETAKQAALVRRADALVAHADPAAFARGPAGARGRRARDVGCQHEQPEDNSLRDANARPPNVAQKPQEGACLHIPALMRCQMSKFPTTMRVPSLQATLRVILAVYLDKVAYDHHCDARGQPRVVLGAFAYRFLLKKFGLVSLADEQASQVVLAVEHHSRHKRVAQFGSWLGCCTKTAAPQFGLRGGAIIFGLLQQLRSTNELSDSVLQQRQSQVDVSRRKALDALQKVFFDQLPDRGAEAAHRVQHLPAPHLSKNPKSVDLDDLLQLTESLWDDVNSLWRGHLQYLFRRRRVLYAVRDEMRFADDAGEESRDVLLVEQEASAGNPYLREARQWQWQVAQKPKAAAAADEDDEDAEAAPVARVELVAMVTFDAFSACVRDVCLDTDEAALRRMFAAGCAAMRAKALRSFDDVWHAYSLDRAGHPVRVRDDGGDVASPKRRASMTGLGASVTAAAAAVAAVVIGEKPGSLGGRGAVAADSRVFYVAHALGRSQWTAPYDADRFTCDELDFDVFADVCLDQGLLHKSPFSALLTKEPKDLWPNAEAYLAQIEENGGVFEP
ncbi:hypothetical protein M885DRAFT_620475 [Pelagophyceae sp. CCMP2097]|nr:hypothetical protein M885DRAFT_620475 [Pelagophyceae sp. CCMP2097]